MATNIAVASAKMDKDLKQSVERIFESMGLNTTTAITLFYKAVLRQNRIPFDIVGDPMYNQETLAAMNESEDMIAHPEKYTWYNDVDKMFEEALKEE